MAQLLFALQAADIGTWSYDLETDTSVRSLRHDQMFGYSEPQATWGKDVAERHVLDEDRPIWREGFERALTTGVLSFEVRVRGPDGVVRWVAPVGQTTYEDGRPVRIAGVIADVTQRRQIEDRLRESEARLRELNVDLERQVGERAAERDRNWQVTPDLLSVVDAPSGCFLRVNPAWQAIFGWTAKEMEGVECAVFIHPDDLEASANALDAVRGNRPLLRFENRYRHKDGSYRSLSWVAVPEGDKIYATARDVTAEKVQATALLDRTAERDRLWDSSYDLLGIAGLDGFLKTINPAWTRSLGWSEQELLTRPFLTLINASDHADTIAVVERLARGETVIDFVDRLKTAGGGERTIMWTAVPELATSVFHIVGRDMTEQRAAEDALRQSQKMEAVGHLTGGLAHDFNNLLTGVTGSLDLLQTRMRQGRLSDVERYITAAQGAAQRAAALTHRLLAFSRQQTLEPKATDINRLVNGIEELVRRTVGPSIAVETVGSAGLWNTFVDAGQLENALLNLCINARDAMPDGGKITIETANRWMDERGAKEHDMPPGQYVSLCVSDSGTGMPPDVVARAFDPFFTTKPIGQGTGLGLSMIYGFTKQSGGQARIYSELGEGTMVCMYLPRHLGEEEAVTAAADFAAAPRADAGETVLVVDDEPTVRMLVTDVLEELGYAAIEASDGPSGLRVLQSNARIDLLVTDVGLPGGMNGRQVADAARAARPGLKVLFITGYAENAVLNHGHLEHGMQVMTKPFAMEALASKIKDLLRTS